MTWEHIEGSSDVCYAGHPSSCVRAAPRCCCLSLHEMLGALEWCFQKELFYTLAAVGMVVPNWPGSRTLLCLKQSKQDRYGRSGPLKEVSEHRLIECPVWDEASLVRVTLLCVLSAGEGL